jgi:hypothetical protein
MNDVKHVFEPKEIAQKLLQFFLTICKTMKSFFKLKALNSFFKITNFQLLFQRQERLFFLLVWQRDNESENARERE